MKKVLFTLALLTALPTMAETAQQAKDNYCNSIARVAELTMRNRQLGTPLSKLLEKVSEADPSIQGTLRELTLWAYEHPRYQGESMQQRTIEDFRNEAHVICLRPRNKAVL